MADVTVAIPVGPRASACTWLPEAIASVRNQVGYGDAEILLIDDMHGTEHDGCALGFFKRAGDVPVWSSPWRLGVAHAFNFGVALAKTELVIMLGADDTLEPEAVQRALEAWSNVGVDAYYYFGVRYMDTGETQTVPCGEAMVSKGLWRKTGGFPVESEVGACDAALISIMLVHMPELLIPIADGAPLVNYRRHEDTDTASRGAWQGPIIESRNILTQQFRTPQWGRYA